MTEQLLVVINSYYYLLNYTHIRTIQILCHLYVTKQFSSVSVVWQSKHDHLSLWRINGHVTAPWGIGLEEGCEGTLNGDQPVDY